MKRTISRKADWLCSKCGQVSNNSEPCHDCARKEWDANPVPPPPKPDPEITPTRRCDFGAFDFILRFVRVEK